ncbi:phosphonate ABC transporter ATP-binding protein [Latilactobacillus sakei]|uniref:phosphonate ABC transporter ATP-binding protein n=1 Tax=Latilactobacillus sakei TaxID=1599 RepID=UPI00232CB9EA|nr:phosphonate ABC transporter ATP-binding protein [Latilactobacillus sakei]MDB1553580.1 phosphonate ABC transporter ATP-binding protein [Latilactobacillus sakei]
MLSVNHINKTFATGRQALTDISFTANKGEFIAIIGPSGAGKSTILRSINRLINTDSGEISLDGQDIRHAKKKELRLIRRQIGMIFQSANLVPYLTVIENVLHGRLGYQSTLRGVFGWYSQVEKEEAVALLTAVGLADFMYNRCDELSGGQMQRVGIARALMQHPNLLLCDEPIASLDPQSAKTVMDYLHRLTKKANITCIVNLHQIDAAREYADRILGINQGHLVFSGIQDELTPTVLEQLYQDSED